MWSRGERRNGSMRGEGERRGSVSGKVREDKLSTRRGRRKRRRSGSRKRRAKAWSSWGRREAGKMGHCRSLKVAIDGVRICAGHFHL